MRRSVVCAFAVALVAAACGRGENNPLVGGEPKSGGRIVVASASPSSLDPSQGARRAELYVLKQICDTLVAFDPVTGALRPGAAETWSFSPDAKKVTFRLRQGVKFHNGRDVTAQDYVYSLSRFVNQDVGSPSYFILDKVVGYREVLERRSDTLPGVKAVDPLTLEIDLIEPFAEFPAVLAHPAAGAAIPKEEVDKGAEAFAQMPVCTGPYRVEEAWGPGQDIVLVKADGYHGRNEAYTNGGAGYAEEIVIRTVPDLGPDIPDVASGYSWLVDGQVDVSEVPLQRLPGARRLRGASVVEGPLATFEYLGFPTKKLPLDNAGLRQALGFAIDREDVTGDLLDGTRIPADRLLPPAAGPASARSTCPSVKPAPNDEAAREALGRSGVSPTGFRLSVYYNEAGENGHERWLGRVTGAWEDTLNIVSRLEPKPRDEYFRFLAEGNADGPFRSVWPVGYPSAEAVWGPLLGPVSGDNFSKYASEEFDAALKAARAATDDRVRADAYAKVAEIVCRDLPITPVWFDESHFAVRDRVVARTDSFLDIYGDPILRELGEAP